jgi:hypothetical protein
MGELSHPENTLAEMRFSVAALDQGQEPYTSGDGPGQKGAHLAKSAQNHTFLKKPNINGPIILTGGNL